MKTYFIILKNIIKFNKITKKEKTLIILEWIINLPKELLQLLLHLLHSICIHISDLMECILQYLDDHDLKVIRGKERERLIEIVLKNKEDLN